MVEHLSILKDEAMRELREKAVIDDAFPDENVLAASQHLILCFADFVNCRASHLDPLDLTFHQRKKCMHVVKKFFWDAPYLNWSCADGIILRCVPEVDMLSILELRHLVGTVVVFEMHIISCICYRLTLISLKLLRKENSVLDITTL